MSIPKKRLIRYPFGRRIHHAKKKHINNKSMFSQSSQEGMIMFTYLKRAALMFCCVSTVLLTSCATPRGDNEAGGMIIGGILGGVLGHEIGGGHGRAAATIIGTMIGTSIGGNVGRSMDKTDRLYVARSLESVRTGVSTTWRNPDSGYQYSVVPTRTYNVNSAPCREYTLDASIGGKTEQIYGTACRQPDGSWKVKN
jgi:surface antigen